MSLVDAVRDGYVKMKSSKSRKWKKTYLILKKPSSKGKLRLEKYEDERSALMGAECKVIELSDVKSIDRLPIDSKRWTVNIVFINDTSQQFYCDSNDDSEKWLMAITEEYKKIGDRSGNKGYFNVNLLANPNIAFAGECLLYVRTDHLLLTHVDSENNVIASWKFFCLRKFSADENKFTFESGRRCDTGEGLFILNTKEATAIETSLKSAITVLQEHDRILKQFNNPRGPPPSLPFVGVSNSTSVNSGLSSPRKGSLSATMDNVVSPQSSPKYMGGVQRSVSSIDSFNRQMLISEDVNGEGKVFPSAKNRPPVPTPRSDLQSNKLICYDQSEDV